MPNYVDGFVLPLPRKNLDAYRKMSRKAARIWMEYGALEYCECAGDDLKIDGMLSFLKLAEAKADETIVFAWIVYKSRSQRDRVNKLIMADPRIAKMMSDGPPPFDCKRMAYGGFKVFVEAMAKAAPTRKVSRK